MKKQEYITPAIQVVEMEGQTLLAGSGEDTIEVNVNQDEVFDGPFRSRRRTSVWESGEDNAE